MKLKRKDKWYVAYKGDNFICQGTAEEMARFLDIRVESVYYYATDTYKRRIENKDKDKRIIVYEVEE